MKLMSVITIMTLAASMLDVMPGAALDQGGSLGAQTEVHIRLNGKLFALGRQLSNVRRAEAAYVRVRDLVKAVDGDATGSPRLRINGARLEAIATGGCDICPIRVARSVMISSRLRVFRNEPYLPLIDLLRALEGRLEIDEPARNYAIYVGSCTWCVLEPKPDPRADGQ